MRMLAVVAVLFVSRAAPAEEIVVGQVAALSGPARGLGEGMRAGLAAAIAEANARGGVHGRKLRLVSADDGYEPDATVDKTVQLIEKEKVRDAIRAGYLEASRARKVLDRLKEKRAQAYHREQLEDEVKLLDDLGSSNAARRMIIENRSIG